MTSRWWRALPTLLLLCALPTRGEGQLLSLQTRDLHLLYLSSAQEYLVPHIARCFHNALSFHERLFDYVPSEPVVVLAQDFSDYGNAGASTIPRNTLSVAYAPMDYAYETAPSNERMNTIMNHELVHILTSDGANGRDRFYRSFFLGKVNPAAEQPLSMLYSFLTSPRKYSPRWYREGIAVFMETWMAGGMGRALSPYDEMVFRTIARDGAYLYDVVGLEAEGTSVDFQIVANAYLYGTRFMNYLAYQHGPERLLEWIKRNEGSRGYFASQFALVFGEKLDDEWRAWQTWEKKWQQKNLDSIRQYRVTAVRPILARPVGSVSRAFLHRRTNRLLAGVNYPGQVPSIAAIDLRTGALEDLCELKGAALYYVASLAYDEQGDRLFFTTDNNNWRDLQVLDLGSGTVRTLMTDERIGDLAFNRADSSLWGMRHFNGISTIVRIPSPYTEWEQVASLPYGLDLFDLDISPDGRILSAAQAEVTGRQTLVALSLDTLMTGTVRPRLLYDFENSTPSNFTFTPDGRALVGTSYYTGVSNIVRYDLAGDRMEWLTNCETGLFRPVAYGGDSLIAFEYSGRGFTPVVLPIEVREDVAAIRYLGQEVVTRYPVVTTWKLPPPSRTTVNIDSLTVSTDPYLPFKEVGMESGYPILEGYKDFAGLGWRANFSDPLMIHRFDIGGSYSPNTLLPPIERLHVQAGYATTNWSVVARYNGADFYDLFGPTKTSRKGTSLSVQYKNYILYDEPQTIQYALRAFGIVGLDVVPDYQNIRTSYDRHFSVSGWIAYKNFRSSLGAVDQEKGVRLQLAEQTNIVRNAVYPRLTASGDLGLPLPIDHSSLWLRASVGASVGPRDEPFANYFFGGFGNNWVDYQDPKRYRDVVSFPGVEINALGGKTFVRGLAEWTLPPIRFRELGFSGLYGTWLRTALFAGVLATDPEYAEGRRVVTDAGVQVDFRFVILWSLNMTLSLGAAAAVEEGEPLSHELMISLKIL